MSARVLLNSNVDFAAFAPDVKAAFKGMPRKQPFRTGELLFRFTTLPEDGFDGNHIFGSPWWVPRETFSTLVRIAHRTKQPLPAAARARLAVRVGWSPTMEYVAVIELTDSVFGWVGPTSPQPLEGDDRSVLLLGNLDQIFLPGLAAAARACRARTHESTRGARSRPPET